MVSPLVSVCVVCKDRWELTRQALESIQDNTDLDAIRFHLVDDVSVAEVYLEIDQWIIANRLAVNFVHEGRTLGVGGAKNLAAMHASLDQSKYLCLLDNDIVCKLGWLETLIDAYENAKLFGYKLLGGYAHPFNQTNCRHVPFMTTRQFELHEKNAVDGLCHFMEWETWDRFGPYDSHAQGVRQSEDFAFCRKIVDAGFKVGVVWPHVIENHGVVDTFGEKIPGWELVEKELQR